MRLVSQHRILLYLHFLTLWLLIVILGVDTVPYGPAVVNDFQKNGYIVIASVFSGEATDNLERNSQGYVRALVLDAEEVSYCIRDRERVAGLTSPAS